MIVSGGVSEVRGKTDEELRKFIFMQRVCLLKGLKWDLWQELHVGGEFSGRKERLAKFVEREFDGRFRYRGWRLAGHQCIHRYTVVVVKEIVRLRS